MPNIKSDLTDLGIEHVLQSADGRTLKPTFLKFTNGFLGVELLDGASRSLGTLSFEQGITWLAGDSLQIAGLELEVSIKVAFRG